MASLHPPLDNAQDTGQVLYTSLLVLGLDAATLEHNLRTPVNQKMFVRMNKKLGEHILHFLFVCIDRDKASKVFRDCWPLFDKRQESQFHKATFEWYKSLQQNYGQPVPTVVAKTFMAPGGPKFTTTLRTLIRIAHHTSYSRKDPECNILGFPTFTRCPEKNRTALTLLRASKQAHHREFLVRQKLQQNVLKRVQEKAKELANRYRSLCSQSDKAVANLQETLYQNERLTQHQKEIFAACSLSDVQNDIQEDISKMNSEAKGLWDYVEHFQQVEESSWKVLSPLLNGTTSLSHVDGSMYSPQIPDMIYKEHATEINKLGLQGLYKEDKLDLMNLVLYSNLALKSLLVTVCKTHSQAKPESTDELNIQKGRVGSLSETVNELTNKLNTLLPELMESVAKHQQQIIMTNPALESIVQDGKPQLCPPTPPLCLVNSPAVANGGLKYAPLMLTPGVQRSHAREPQRENSTPSRVVSKYSKTKAAERSIKGSILYSSTTHTDNSVMLTNGEDSKELETDEGLAMEMLTMDGRVRYQLKQEMKAAQEKQQNTHHREGKKSSIPKRRIPKENKKPTENNNPVDSSNRTKKILTKVEMNVKDTNERNMNSSLDNNVDLDSSLIDRLAEVVVADDDSGAVELSADIQTSGDMKENPALDSGCAEGSGSETLLDAIEKMSITPKKNQESRISQSKPGSPKKYGTPFRSITSRLMASERETSERYKSNGETQASGSQYTRLIDVTPCSSLSTANQTPTGTPVRDPFLTPSQKPVGIGKTADVSRQLLATLSLDKREEISQDLRARMSLLTQSPLRDTATPLGPKILANFTGLGMQDVPEEGQMTSHEKISSEDISRGAATEKLQHHSKTNLSNLIEQVQKIKQDLPESDVKLNENRDGSKSKFLSFVEKLKTERRLSISKNGQSNQNKTVRKTSLIEEKSTDNSAVTDRKIDFLSNMTRMQSLLGDDDDDDDDDDDTLTGSSYETKSFQMTLDKEEEVFINSHEIEKTLLKTPGRRSSYLPEGSVFDTLTDAILVGETASSILRDEGAKAEVRRESISTRRQSIVSTGRMSVGANRRLSDVFTVFQNRMSAECHGILDVSDSCLLSTSMDEFLAG